MNAVLGIQLTNTNEDWRYWHAFINYSVIMTPCHLVVKQALKCPNICTQGINGSRKLIWGQTQRHDTGHRVDTSSDFQYPKGQDCQLSSLNMTIGFLGDVGARTLIFCLIIFFGRLPNQFQVHILICFIWTKPPTNCCPVDKKVFYVIRRRGQEFYSWNKEGKTFSKGYKFLIVNHVYQFASSLIVLPFNLVIIRITKD